MESVVLVVLAQLACFFVLVHVFEVRQIDWSSMGSVFWTLMAGFGLVNGLPEKITFNTISLTWIANELLPAIAITYFGIMTAIKVYRLSRTK